MVFISGRVVFLRFRRFVEIAGDGVVVIAGVIVVVVGVGFGH
jgi:hypothetical protein